MAKLTQTVREARDHILKRLNAVGSTDYEGLVLELLNHAVVFVSTAFDWEYLRKKATLTTTDATGLVTLPADLDRVMVIHSDGSNYYLSKLEPLNFEQAVEDTGITESMFWCVQGYAQETTTTAPSMQIAIHSAPASGAEFILWYIKSVDEFTTASLDTVPMLPPHIWDVVIRKATLEALKIQESPPSTIAQEERHLIAVLNLYKTRENRGSSRRSGMKNVEYVSNYRAGRMVGK
jgi:hypothetical protein